MKPDRQSASGDPGAAEAVAPRPARAVSLLSGFREPIVAILLAIAFFTAISGKPVDGVLLLAVAVSLAWDAGTNAGDTGTHAGDTGTYAGDTGSRGAARPRARPGSPTGARRHAATLALLAGGALYAWVVGSFTRFSWPATAGIAGLGTVVVLAGWHGRPRRRGRDHLPAVGVLLWSGLLLMGGVWELVALLRQPSLTTTSYAHPTLSALSDPVLAGGAGRSVFLAGWLATGWYLVRR